MRSLSPKSNPKTTPPTSKTKTKQNRVDFDELAPFFENQSPELRFLPTGVTNFDRALGGEGLPSNVVTHWRAPHTFAADALLLELCRAACAKGERVCIVDAANRFEAASKSGKKRLTSALWINYERCASHEIAFCLEYGAPVLWVSHF